MTVTVTDAVDGLDVTVAPAGVTARAVAVLVIVPLSRSACVAV